MFSATNKLVATALLVLLFGPFLMGQEGPPKRPLRVDPAPIASAKPVKYDYDIVYVRAPRTIKDSKTGKDTLAMVWPDASKPFDIQAPTDLMLLHPDGKEEVLVAGAPGAITDPHVSFDAQWVYYTYCYDVPTRRATAGAGGAGADVYKIHVPSRKITRLTHGERTPNTGVPVLKGGGQPIPAVYNMHPCPLPGGRVAFVSNRDGLQSPRSFLQRSAMQLFTMDADGGNVEKNCMAD